MYTNSNLNDYFRSYCWIHGTAYIREHLQGKATGCFVDQSRIESEEDAPVSLSMLLVVIMRDMMIGDGQDHESEEDAPVSLM